jgi:hypothetical protein
MAQHHRHRDSITGCTLLLMEGPRRVTRCCSGSTKGVAAAAGRGQTRRQHKLLRLLLTVRQARR